MFSDGFLRSSARRSPDPRGVTLVEVLVALAILTVLISILLPVLNSARGAARIVACSSNLRQIGHAFHLYAAEHHGALPPGSIQWNTGGNPPAPPAVNGWSTDFRTFRPGVWGPAPDGYSLWQHFLWPYAGQTLEVFTCPANLAKPSEDYLGQTAVHGDWVFWWFNYQINRPLTGGFNPTPDKPTLAIPKYARHFRNAQSTYLVSDGSRFGLGMYTARLNKEQYYFPGQNPAGYIPYAPNSGSRNRVIGQFDDAVNGRHRNRSVNVLYVDGHVVTESAARIWTISQADTNFDHVFWYGK